MQLHDPTGRRLYLTSAERDAFFAVADRADSPVRTLCLVLHTTGCRISEALALTPARIDMEGPAIVFESLKKRRRGVYRAVPVPFRLVDILNMGHDVRKARKRGRGHADQPLWRSSRMTAWRRVIEVMNAAGIEEGPHRCPKGLRHGYGVHAINSGVPLNMLQKWMGHAQLETTAIYANALGAEEQAIAARMWRGGAVPEEEATQRKADGAGAFLVR